MFVSVLNRLSVFVINEFNEEVKKYVNSYCEVYTPNVSLFKLCINNESTETK